MFVLLLIYGLPQNAAGTLSYEDLDI